MQTYQTLKGVCVRELTVERSRFIAASSEAKSEEQAKNFIAERRALFHDAKHHAFAYSVDGVSRCSDDGEPHGTAGKPISDLLSGGNIIDACVVVTRYFGGVLLGTGGLSRAYSAAAKLSLDSAEKRTLVLCAIYSLSCGYSDFDYLKRTVTEFGEPLDFSFFEKPVLSAAVPQEREEDFLSSLRGRFGGRVSAEKTAERATAVKNFK